MEIPFTSSDVEVLLAIAYGQGRHGVDLAGLIGAADALFHEILTARELRRGLARLAAARYACESGQRFLLTDAGRALAQDGRRNEGWMEARERLCRQLAVDSGPRNAPDFDDPDWPYPGLTDEAVAAAVAAYRRRFL